MQQFGQHLRSLREEKGLSRVALRDLVVERYGRDAAVSEDTLANWENGETEGMSASKLAVIVTVLEADYEDVFSRLVEADPPPEKGRGSGGGKLVHAFEFAGLAMFVAPAIMDVVADRF